MVERETLEPSYPSYDFLLTVLLLAQIADCLGLSRPSTGGESPGGYGGDDGDNWGHYGGDGKYGYQQYGNNAPYYAGRGGSMKRHIKRGETPAKPKKYH